MHIQQSARDDCICDLSKAATIDPVCASVFAAVAHRPMCDTLDQAVAQARSRPPFLREQTLPPWL